MTDEETPAATLRLTVEELEELRIAIENRMHSLVLIREHVTDIGTLSTIDHKGNICASLLTAVQEARYSVRDRPGDDTCNER